MTWVSLYWTPYKPLCGSAGSCLLSLHLLWHCPEAGILPMALQTLISSAAVHINAFIYSLYLYFHLFS